MQHALDELLLVLHLDNPDSLWSALWKQSMRDSSRYHKVHQGRREVGKWTGGQSAMVVN